VKKSLLILATLTTFLAAEYNDFYSAKKEPTQKKIKPYQENFKGSLITHLYSYKIKSRVLSSKIYSGDSLSKIAKTDLGVAWGKMSETQNFNKFKWDQENRFLIYLIDNRKIKNIGGEDYANSHIANIHLIARNQKIENILKKINKYDIVEIQGTLVDVQLDNKIYITSDTRTDSGGGSCEIIMVEKVKIIHSRKPNVFYNTKTKEKDRLSNKYRKTLDYSQGENTRGYNLK